MKKDANILVQRDRFTKPYVKVLEKAGADALIGEPYSVQFNAAYQLKPKIHIQMPLWNEPSVAL